MAGTITEKEKELTTMRRRVASVANHLIPSHSPPTLVDSISIASSNCNASINDSYHRIHGQVPTTEPVWTIACDDSGKDFTDIIYEKADGEAIAKVLVITIIFGAYFRCLLNF